MTLTTDLGETTTIGSLGTLKSSGSTHHGIGSRALKGYRANKRAVEKDTIEAVRAFMAIAEGSLPLK